MKSVDKMLKEHGFESIDEAFLFVCENLAESENPLKPFAFADFACMIARENEDRVKQEDVSPDPAGEQWQVIGYDFTLIKKTYIPVTVKSTATKVLCSFISENFDKVKHKISESYKTWMIQDFLFKSGQPEYIADIECSGIMFANHEFAIYECIKQEFEKAFDDAISEHLEI